MPCIYRQHSNRIFETEMDTGPNAISAKPTTMNNTINIIKANLTFTFFIVQHSHLDTRHVPHPEPLSQRIEISSTNLRLGLDKSDDFLLHSQIEDQDPSLIYFQNLYPSLKKLSRLDLTLRFAHPIFFASLAAVLRHLFHQHPQSYH